MDDTTLIDYARSLDCIHCGLCLATCPTYRITGREGSSPRGRVHLMRAVAEGELEPDAEFAEEMNSCLVCRHCETVCPSGVQFGALMEHTRAGLTAAVPGSVARRLALRLGFEGVLTRRWALGLAAGLLRFVQRTGLTRAAAALLGAHGRALAGLAPVPPRGERAALPRRTPAEEPRLGAVALLEGCVARELLGKVNRATARVLAAAGLEVRTAPEHVCCGSLHAHNGRRDTARALAQDTIERYEALRDERGAPLPLVNNSAGCGSHLKELAALFEPGSEWHARALALSARTYDLAQLLVREPYRARLAARLRAGGGAGLAGAVAYDDPCHLCHGQGVRAEPRALLDLVPGLRRVELSDPESCCGSAGIYSLVRPAAARELLDSKLADQARSGASALVTANPGCQLQWSSGLGPENVLHLAEVLERGLR
jgi:glycolate oxidase iron-sulfur subunit